ncbi:hypothetical protein NITHO_2240004 [Nitrolancea hollandica Lb]|uniref:Uncharacterized protein n=1 Tax=Nitrolancea hollandica Lb TaxID=1129897 RepID=I4EFA3_9BACT|nr:hypothetical protein NITHO_2240004 [Nitrolancea hollandica Lb]
MSIRILPSAPTNSAATQARRCLVTVIANNFEYHTRRVIGTGGFELADQYPFERCPLAVGIAASRTRSGR